MCQISININGLKKTEWALNNIYLVSQCTIISNIFELGI